MFDSSVEASMRSLVNEMDVDVHPDQTPASPLEVAIVEDVLPVLHAEVGEPNTESASRVLDNEVDNTCIDTTASESEDQSVSFLLRSIYLTFLTPN